MKTLLLSFAVLLSVTSFAETTSCTRDKYCLGDQIVTDNNSQSIIKAILPNGEVSIQDMKTNALSNSTTFLLSKTSGCLRDGFCVGQNTVSKNGLKGKVVAINRYSYKVTLKLNNSLDYKQFGLTDLLLSNTNVNEVAMNSKKSVKKFN